jgi:hypothetical protein
MINNNMRKVIIIKNIDSKYVEEAIVFLRKEIPSNANKFQKDYLVKESMNVINKYIERNYLLAGKEENKGLKLMTKKKNIKNYSKMLNISLLLSIMLLAYLITRAL